MKTFKEIIKEMYPKAKGMLTMTEITPLMKFVREETLKECAKKAVITMLITEGAIIKNEKAILSLDKNSLDV